MHALALAGEGMGGLGVDEAGSVRVDDRAQHDAALLGMAVAGTAAHRRALVPYQEIADLPRMVIGEAFLRGVRSNTTRIKHLDAPAVALR